MTWLENQMAQLLIIAFLALPVLKLWRSIVAILVRSFLQLGYFLAMGAGWGWLMWDGLPTHDPFRRSKSLSIAPKNCE
jgi:hypothetical protein